MKRMLSVAWVIGLLLTLAGCASSDEFAAQHPAATGAQTGGASAVEQAVLTGTPAAVPSVGEPVLASINRFPADTGTQPLVNGHQRMVPQQRGQDRRPHGLVQPTIATQTTDPAMKTAFATLPAGTLVLYDSTGPYAWLGELYGIASINLASHFGGTASKPVLQYQAGDMAKYQAVLYVGSTYDEPLPVAFLDDVLAGTTPVIWVYDNIWQLANRAPDFFATYGFNPWAFDFADISWVTYKGTQLTRDKTNGSGILQFSPFDETRVQVLATANRADGTTLPWAVRSGHLTYIGEVPYAYIDHNDRYLAFCDLLFDVLAPTTVPQHRALVRLEDVNPMSDAAALKAIADYLYSQQVPFSIAIIPMYSDPLGVFNKGKAQNVKWTQKAAMLSAVKYAISKGGTLIQHGYTHQYGTKQNPYNGVTGDDFEFFLAHVDLASQNVIYDGAVSNDSAAWALSRVNSGLAALKAAGLPTPTLFEYPHYAGSPVDSKAIRGVYPVAYHRGLYFGGDLGLNPVNMGHTIGLFYPFTVTDVYGWKLKPENLGNYEPEAYNNHPPRVSADIVATAQKNLVIRDGVASFFFHPYEPLTELKTIVTGIKAAGYKFVSVSSL